MEPRNASPLLVSISRHSRDLSRVQNVLSQIALVVRALITYFSAAGTEKPEGRRPVASGEQQRGSVYHEAPERLLQLGEGKPGRSCVTFVENATPYQKLSLHVPRIP